MENQTKVKTPEDANMEFEIENVRQTEISDEEFIAMCKKSYKKITGICFLILLAYIGIALLVFSDQSNNLFIKLFGFGSIPGFISFVMLFGNFSSYGIIQTYIDCKTIDDWILFAKTSTFIQDRIILAKYLQANKLRAIKLVSLNSHEMQCVDIETSKVKSLYFGNKKFFLIFRIRENHNLEPGKMEIDLTQDDMTAYISSLDYKNYNMENSPMILKKEG